MSDYVESRLAELVTQTGAPTSIGVRGIVEACDVARKMLDAARYGADEADVSAAMTAASKIAMLEKAALDLALKEAAHARKPEQTTDPLRGLK